MLYTTEPLSVGGRVTCSFEIIVERGFGLAISNIGRRAKTNIVQEFLVAELHEGNAGARLPAVTGRFLDEELAIGVLAPTSSPFPSHPRSVLGAKKQHKRMAYLYLSWYPFHLLKVGHQVYLDVWLEWCVDTIEEPDLATLVAANVTIEVTGTAGRVPLDFDTRDSRVALDGSCCGWWDQQHRLPRRCSLLHSMCGIHPVAASAGDVRVLP